MKSPVVLRPTAASPTESQVGFAALAKASQENALNQAEDQSHDSSPSVAPTLQLSRRGLVFCLLAMVGIGLGVYSMFPSSVGGPSLPVDVKLDRRMVETVGGRGAIATEVVVVRNLADYPIPRLSIDINGQYLLFRDAPLEIAEELVLPQQVFTDKRSSYRFDPSQYDVEEVVVTGQLPSGARGVTKFEFENEQPKTISH